MLSIVTLMVGGPYSRTVLEDAHVLLLGQDGIVGVETILLQHSLIAVRLLDAFILRYMVKTRRTPSLFNVYVSSTT